ncbi:MAG: TIGR03936 family radical SAM-associated protein [Thermoanaerobacterium sp.]|nr:TIGR03936 family radical SAM-associated protein [Thermoanaerobacterium sp.]
MKLRAKFKKDGDLKYISHLDLMRTIERAMRRAQIKFSLSKGFNPHPLISFGPALSMGATTHGDYFDVVIDDEIEPQKFKDDLNMALPDGLEIIDCYIVDDKDLLSNKVKEAEYIVDVYLVDDKVDFAAEIKRFLGRSEILVEKETKSGSKIIDLKSYILDLKILDVQGNKISLYTKLKISEGSPGPVYVVKALDDFLGHVFDMKRILVDRRNLILN